MLEPEPNFIEVLSEETYSVHFHNSPLHYECLSKREHEVSM